MAYELRAFDDIGLDEALLRVLIDEHEEQVVPRMERLLSFWSDESAMGDEVSFGMSAARDALPSRLTQPGHGASPKEIVIENDIGWRVQTIVDYVAGRDLRILSQVENPERRAFLQDVAEAILEASGGLAFVQEAVLLGAIYGHVDILVRSRWGDVGEETDRGSDLVKAAASRITLDLIEAPRGIALQNDQDYRSMDAYVLHYHRLLNEVESVGVVSRLGRWIGGREVLRHQRLAAEVTEVISATSIEVYENEALVWQGENPMGRVPVCHIQHQRVPFSYGGLGEIEALIPMQTELNTRLSDRANRVTMQSFKMYLGRGIEGFGERPIGPGQMWLTDNPDASIECFGADASSPSEDEHIREIREAMDKISSVSPLAAGIMRTRVGTLSSENALRISMLGVLSKTERLRQLYGRGLTAVLEIAFEALDRMGLVPTSESERLFDLEWSSPIPVDERQRLADAVTKRDLGIPLGVILEELGYGGVGSAANVSEGE